MSTNLVPGAFGRIVICCHENVTQIAENGGKNAANHNK
jgi:hypothetical protein